MKGGEEVWCGREEGGRGKAGLSAAGLFSILGRG